MSTSFVSEKSVHLTPSNLSTSRASVCVYPSPQEQEIRAIKTLGSHKRMSMKQFPVCKYRIIKPLSYTPKNNSFHLSPTDSIFCSEHNKSKEYFCLTCQVRICPSCSIFQSKHTHHQLRRYDAHLGYSTEIQHILTQIKQNKQKILNERRCLEQQLKVARYQKEKRLQHIDRIQELMVRVCQAKMEGVSSSYEKMKEEQSSLACLENLYSESISLLKKLPRSELIHNSQNIKQKIIDSYSHLMPIQVFIPYISDQSFVHPPYEEKYMLIQEYEKARERKNEPIIDYITYGNNKWKIKVYPNGYVCATSSPKMKEREYLSIYLEMQESAKLVPIQFDIKIALIHENRVNHLQRHFKCFFQKGESWGYDRITRVENLFSRQLISKHGSLMIKFSIAFNNFQYPLEQINSILENKQDKIDKNKKILNSYLSLLEPEEYQEKQTETRIDPSKKDSKIISSSKLSSTTQDKS